MTSSGGTSEPVPNWEAFYGNYRSPDYVRGYEITDRLGGGTTGLVFRARKHSIGKDYAIKFLKVDDAEVRRAVLREIEQVNWFAQVDHPNLVAIEDRGEVDGIPFLVMAHAGEETLRDRLRAGDADPDELMRYFLQACRGVAALHDRSLVHFDLKPENVFLKGGVARVGDYGLSKLVAPSRNSLSMGRGTPYYMAPEMLQRRGDHRSDIYSLGVVLYEVLAGEVPFQGESEWEVLRRHEVEAPRYPAHITAVQKAVLERCLTKEPEDRYASVRDLMADLGAPMSAGEATVADAMASPAAAGGSRAASGTGGSTVLALGNAPTRRAESRARGVSVARFAVAILLLMSLGLFATFSTYQIAQRQQAFASAQHRHVQRMRVQHSRVNVRVNTLDARLREFGREANRAVLRARSSRSPRAPQLRELRKPRGYSDFSLRAYEDLLRSLACGVFSVGHAKKLELYGYPMFLAAVDYLQDLDYRACDDLQKAFNVHLFLEHATGWERLDMYEPRTELSRRKRHANRAVADSWRRFAEIFCRSEEDWQETLKATGKLSGSGH